MSDAAEEHPHYGARMSSFVLAIPIGIVGLVLDSINCGLVRQRIFGCSNIGAQLFGEAASKVIAQVGTIMILVAVIMFVVSFMMPSKEGSGIENRDNSP
ncbi:MAG TPA: hypothetical protein VHK86_03815 [Nitrososphaera sp.]|jgi:uncharacterized PurR-regulated membrane protein YhhQ (DUF165 family)|nr:hypothetical protein [Nitrososphaera sp.]